MELRREHLVLRVRVLGVLGIAAHLLWLLRLQLLLALLLRGEVSLLRYRDTRARHL